MRLHVASELLKVLCPACPAPQALLSPNVIDPTSRIYSLQTALIEGTKI